jgi:hypothetical protein
LLSHKHRPVTVHTSGDHEQKSDVTSDPPVGSQHTRSRHPTSRTSRLAHRPKYNPQSAPTLPSPAFKITRRPAPNPYGTFAQSSPANTPQNLGARPNFPTRAGGAQPDFSPPAIQEYAHSPVLFHAYAEVAHVKIESVHCGTTDLCFTLANRARCLGFGCTDCTCHMT